MLAGAQEVLERCKTASEEAEDEEDEEEEDEGQRWFIVHFWIKRRKQNWTWYEKLNVIQ